jgi:hypothetical protein
MHVADLRLCLSLSDLNLSFGERYSFRVRPIERNTCGTIGKALNGYVWGDANQVSIMKGRFVYNATSSPPRCEK